MSDAELYRQKVTELRSQLICVVEVFAAANPNMPAQIMMAGLGELLIDLSVTQTGKKNTLGFLAHLREAVEKFGDKIAPEH